MPYIAPEKRELLDDHITALTDRINKVNRCSSQENDFAGILNYCITRLILDTVPKKGYDNLARIEGVLSHISKEFYRREVSSYEDKKIIENGDIPGFN